MACQTTPEGVLLWRFIAGIGIGVEIITIDAYITELVPSWMRGRAFAVNQAVMFTAVPVVAALAWWLVPLSPYGVDGWRWVVLIGAAGGMVIWILRLTCRKAALARAPWQSRGGGKNFNRLEASAGTAMRLRSEQRMWCPRAWPRRWVTRSCSNRRTSRLS